jgi:signal transduction histidine kinase
MWTTRPDTTLDYLNKFCVEFTGMPLSELLDEGWLKAVHPDDLDRIQQIYFPACTTEGDFAAMTPDAALCVYRIAQEALRNVIAHAGARGADVRLRQDGHQAEITISDDGRGFDATHRSDQAKALGLISISERAKILGGSVRIESTPNAGTRVQATIPIKAPVEGQVA